MEDLHINPVIHYVNIVTPEQKAGTVWARRSFVDYQIQFMKQGSMKFELHESAETFVIKPGEISFIAPGELNTQTLLSDEKDSYFDCVHFLLSPLPEEKPYRLPPRVRSKLDMELYSNLFQRLYDAFHGSGQYSSEIASCIVKELYLRLLQTDDTQDENGAARVKEMTKYLDEHLTAHPGRSELARRFHLAPEYINQLFQKHMGISPGNYVHRQIAREAYRILTREKLSIKECAEVLGFKNQFHFTRIFRKIYSVPPSKLRDH